MAVTRVVDMAASESRRDSRRSKVTMEQQPSFRSRYSGGCSRGVYFMVCLLLLLSQQVVGGAFLLPVHHHSSSLPPSDSRFAAVPGFLRHRHGRSDRRGSSSITTKLRDTVSLETETDTMTVQIVSDVDEAVEQLLQNSQEADGIEEAMQQQVIIESELPCELFFDADEMKDNMDEADDDCIVRNENKTQMVREIEQLLMEKNDLLAALDVTNLAENLQGLFQSMMMEGEESLLSSWQQPAPPTPEEAAVSASLYMNHAAETIAPHLTVTWEPEVAELVQKLHQMKKTTNRPLMVGVVGIPGSGKSTSCEILMQLINRSFGGKVEDDNERAVVVPMDGYHLSLEELGTRPDAADAIYRRGAPDTFDPDTLEATLGRIAYGDDAEEGTLKIPGFDHAVGDPVPDQHTFVRSKHEIVICEGIYLLHDSDGWENIRSFFDWTIYIDANVDACIERLKERNKCIPGYTPEEIELRCDVVDRKNAEMSRDSAHKYACQIVRSGASTAV